MFRIGVLSILMIIIYYLPEAGTGAAGSMIAYKDYYTALVISMLITPWVRAQFD